MLHTHTSIYTWACVCACVSVRVRECVIIKHKTYISIYNRKRSIYAPRPHRQRGSYPGPRPGHPPRRRRRPAGRHRRRAGAAVRRTGLAAGVRVQVYNIM